MMRVTALGDTTQNVRAFSDVNAIACGKLNLQNFKRN